MRVRSFSLIIKEEEEYGWRMLDGLGAVEFVHHSCNVGIV